MMTASPRFRPVWRSAGYLFFGLGAAGIVLPLLPTTGPWILAVWCLWKGDDPLARKLLDHPRFGEPLRAWFEHGRISRRGKIAATAGMAVAMGLVVAFTGLPDLWLVGLAATLVAAAAWIWTRPTA
ncbi:MAG: YbaN family protein [Pseudomonadota bacterium]